MMKNQRLIKDEGATMMWIKNDKGQDGNGGKRSWWVNKFEKTGMK